MTMHMRVNQLNIGLPQYVGRSWRYPWSYSWRADAPESMSWAEPEAVSTMREQYVSRSWALSVQASANHG